jgi:menaquinone-dependent protoporphyrinogen oxidase
MKVLVAVGSKYGSSRAIAKTIATTLEGHGFDVDFQDVRSVMPFDAVILGSAVYGGLWRRDASALAKEHREALRLRDVWTFSVGMENVVVAGQPKDEAYAIADAISAREHKRFSGALDPEKLNIGERALIRALDPPLGDFRNFDEVKSWAESVASQLQEAAIS